MAAVPATPAASPIKRFFPRCAILHCSSVSHPCLVRCLKPPAPPIFLAGAPRKLRILRPLFFPTAKCKELRATSPLQRWPRYFKPRRSERGRDPRTDRCAAPPPWSGRGPDQCPPSPPPRGRRRGGPATRPSG